MEEQKKPVPNERTENIAALSVFAALMIIVVGLFTGGFGLFGKGPGTNPNERISVPIEADPVRGNVSTAQVAIVIFSDFECPFCKKGEETVGSVFQKYDGKVILIFKNFPLVKIHKDAFNAALAAECANEQGKFWEYHDYLFSHNNALTVPDLKAYAKELGLDEPRFSECLDSQRYAQNVNRDAEVGKRVGVSGTPTFFINGIQLVGSQPESEFVKLIEPELSRK